MNTGDPDQLPVAAAVNNEASILNALPAQIALLDTKGFILAVNEPWRRFAHANTIRSLAAEIA